MKFLCIFHTAEKTEIAEETAFKDYAAPCVKTGKNGVFFVARLRGCG